ncbi:MAG: (d)CMP kinase [Peptococcaceae bacterium]|nr:(d)CMP kinase [Peptococcaceae bacterium]
MTKNNLLHVAIDGPAGAGKSSVAREVARRLGILYLDTGAMYRAFAWKALEQAIDLADADALAGVVRETTLDFDVEHYRIFCDETDVTEAIRTPQVSAGASAVAVVPGVRTYLTELQRRKALENSIVLDGRDIGSCVLPNAPVKIFLTADLRERARRRQKDLREQGRDVDIERVMEDMEARDRQDAQRAAAPMVQAEDAVLIDTSYMAFDEVVERVLELVRGVRP